MKEMNSFKFVSYKNGGHACAVGLCHSMRLTKFCFIFQYYASELSRPGTRREGWGSAEATEMVLNNLFYITAKVRVEVKTHFVQGDDLVIVASEVSTTGKMSSRPARRSL